jgi:8-oxo-dGTP pyrophosphatase MutT (NUDIX family)
LSTKRPRTPELVIPTSRLPRGLAEAVDSPPSVPVPALPAATAVLLRDASRGPEVLLLCRRRDSGFVPGAYVFPGGRIDAADSDPAVLARTDGVVAESAKPEFSTWVAAAREVFEETGVLLARARSGEPVADAVTDFDVARWRDELLENRATLNGVLQALDARLDLRAMVYCAHWITPVAERRRYDTRFFLAALPTGRKVSPDPREMTDALWVTPRDALARFAQGALPMVFPTVKTLESIAGFTAVTEILQDFRGRRIEPIMPRLVRTAEGVGIVIDG